MPSPPRSPRGGPPRRAALHERSESQTNRKPAPSLRVVGDPAASVYHSSPYPSKPSQILHPPPGQASALQNVSSTLSQDARDDRPYLAPLRPRLVRPSGADDGRDTNRSSADVSFYTTSTEDDDDEPASTSGSTSAPSHNRDVNANTSFLTSRDQEVGRIEETGRVSGESIVQLPSVPPRAPGHSLSRPTTNQETDEVRQPASKDSDSSLSSTNTTGTVVVRKTRDGRKRASYSAFPFTRPSSSKSNLSPSTPPRSARRPSVETTTPRSPVSPSSPVVKILAPSTGRRSSSLPSRESNSSGGGASRAEYQYPVVRPQAASASWADSSALPDRPPPIAERGQERWNPHLSTVHSVGTSSSPSGERSSRGTMPVGSSRASKSSSNLISFSRASIDFPPVPRRSPEQSPTLEDDSSRRNTPHYSLPLPPPARQRDFSGSTIRMVDEEGEAVNAEPDQSRNISGATVRMVRQDDAEDSSGSSSAGPKIHQNPTVVPRENARDLVTRPASRASFFRDSIPAWAKAYYARPASSVYRPESRRFSTSTDNISLNVFRSRNSGMPRELRRSKMRIGPRPGNLDLEQAQDVQQRRISPDWSPHLWHDRMSLNRRRTIFKAPTFDERAESNPLSKRNIQLVSFAVGFVFPFAWFVASFLPLPRRPTYDTLKGKETARQTQIIEELEKQLGPVDESRYENARWWRNVNRMMTVAGLLIIAAIIVLAVVGSR